MNRSAAVEAFYVSWTWRKCRTAYAKSVGNMCERCRKRGVIEVGSKKNPLETHHKIPLTDDNINDPDWRNDDFQTMELKKKQVDIAQQKADDANW